MKQFTFSMILLWLFAVPGMAATVYKWVDENGTVHYGQRPQQGKTAKQMNIRVKPSSGFSGSESASSDSESEADSKQASSDSGKGKKSADELAWEKKQAEVKKKNCGIAKERMSALMAGGRIYEMKNGERHYLDDSARSAKIKQARESVNKWCN